MSYIVEERALNSDWDGKKRSRSREMMTTTWGSKQNSIFADQVIRYGAVICPSCGYTQDEDEDEDENDQGVNVLQDLPAGVKFDPSDQEILQHLEAKVVFSDSNKLHPLIDHFIPTIDGQNGICYTHPEKLPGVNKEGQVRHFFHRPSKAYTTGTRKRRKVHSDDDDGSETRWHKTGNTRPVTAAGSVRGYKKILVLYTNYGRQQKPDKTNWVMHQYHLGHNQEETEGQFVLSKVFYQTHPRQCGATANSNNPSPSTSNSISRVYNNPNPSSFINMSQRNSLTLNFK